jgi:hypothetical protein
VSNSGWGSDHLQAFLIPTSGTWAGKPPKAVELEHLYFEVFHFTSVWSFQPGEFKVSNFLHGSTELSTHISLHRASDGNYMIFNDSVLQAT